MVVMTRTDALLLAITAELEARRTQIDGDDGLCTVGLIVKLDEKTGAPRQIIWRPESQRRVGRQVVRLAKDGFNTEIVTV
jgi:hypothetical protein